MSWINQFETLSDLEGSTKKILVEQSSVLTVPENTTVFGPGITPDNLLLLIDGTVRVQQLSEQGREIVLYRVRSGESCVLTTACLLAVEDYSAQGITESEVTAVAIPRHVFDELLSQSLRFRQFVFTAFSQRITELFHVVEEVAFQRIDVRLADKLLEFSASDPSIRITHQQLAAELGTAREVISRQLSEFQRRDWIELSRGVISVRNRQGLKILAGN